MIQNTKNQLNQNKIIKLQSWVYEQSISEQILPLTIPEKLQLIEDIWDSVVVDGDKIPLTQAQKEELDRRFASYDNLENKDESWEIVKQKMIYKWSIKLKFQRKQN